MISLDDLRTALRITTTSDDGYLADLEEAAVEFMQNETGRYFGPVGNVTEHLEGDGTRTLWLSEAPATLPTTVTERTEPGASSSTTTTAANSDGYVLRGTLQLVRKAGLVWTLGYEYEVTYSRGYAVNQEPADVRQAVTALVTHWYETRVPVAMAGDASTVVPLHASKIIARWRRRSWA